MDELDERARLLRSWRELKDHAKQANLGTAVGAESTRGLCCVGLTDHWSTAKKIAAGTSGSEIERSGRAIGDLLLLLVNHTTSICGSWGIPARTTRAQTCHIFTG